MAKPSICRCRWLLPSFSSHKHTRTHTRIYAPLLPPFPFFPLAALGAAA